MSFEEPSKQTPETKKLLHHIRWLFNNKTSIDDVHKKRWALLLRILKKMQFIKNDYKGFHTSEFQAHFHVVQLFSYFMSSNWTDNHALKYMAQKKEKKPWNLFYYIVHCIVTSESFAWEAPNGEAMHAFHKNGKQDTYFHCEWDERTISTMAAAAQHEGKGWVSQLWMARKMVSVYNGGEFIPFEKGKPITMSEGWQPGLFEIDEELEETDVPLKQPGLWYYHPENEKKIELFKTVISAVYNDLECYKTVFSAGLAEFFDPIECRNIIIIIMLLEHELVHAYIAREDQSQGLDITEHDNLAIPASFPRYLWMKFSSGRISRNLGVPLTIWPPNEQLDNFTDDQGRVIDPNWRSMTVAPAYTNSAGHGDYFCRFTNMIFGHVGCYASTDTAQFKKKCHKKTWCMTYKQLLAGSAVGGWKMDVDFKLKLVF